MDKNLVVSLDEIKGIRLQCKEAGVRPWLARLPPTYTDPTYTDPSVHKATYGRSQGVRTAPLARS